MDTISIILPIHKLDDSDKVLFEKAIASINQQVVLPEAVIIVIPKENTDLYKYLSDFQFGESTIEYIILLNDGKTDFASQVNFGVEEAKTTWVNLMEFDDEMANIWIKNVKQYATSYPEVGVFTPIVLEVNDKNEFLGLTNEPVWANDFSDKMGFIDHDILMDYQNFSIVGAAIKKDAYQEHGGLKSGIKLYFIYEFLLRMTLKSVEIMVIPKYGHKHLNLREGSLFASYKDEMNPVESNWWLAQAKKEYHFSRDREITYS